jgi:NADH-ubiquinone oxidoreductase chain 2
MTNLNAFLILISVGYTFIFLTKNNKNSESMLKKETLSPIQFIYEMKGFFYINPILTISLGITLYSFVGVPPLMGFFAKQMILSAALDNGYIFMTLIAILTSVISAVYYLAVIKELFFEKSEFKSDTIHSSHAEALNYKNVSLSSSLTSSISILTFIIT